MRLTIRTQEGDRDIAMTMLSDELTLGALLAELGIDENPCRVKVDGVPVAVRDQLRLLPVVDGSVVSIHRSGGNAVAAPSQDIVADLVRVAGPGSGHQVALTAGQYDLGTGNAGGGQLEQPELRFAVAPGRVTVTPLDTVAALSVGGRLLAGPTELDDRPVSVVSNSESIFAVRMRTHSGPRRIVRHRPGKVTFLRPPRRRPADQVPLPRIPERPAPAAPAPPLSVIAMLTPIPMAVVMAFLLNPRFLLMALMSPMMFLGRWLDGRRRNRKETARVARETAERGAEFAAALEECLQETARLRHRAHPDMGELLGRIRREDPRIWERRPGHDDFLEVTLGYGPFRYQPDLDVKALFGPLHEMYAAARLENVPLTVDLEAEQALGVAGDGTVTKELVTAIVAAIAANHGPGDVSLTILSDQPDSWDWAKWLPHLVDDHGDLSVGFASAEVETLLAAAASPSDEDGGPLALVIADGDGVLDRHSVRLAEAVRANEQIRVIALASAIDLLPSMCSRVVDVDASGSLSLIDPTGHEAPLGGLAVLVDPLVAEAVGRGLARLVDPDRTGTAGGIPPQAALVELIGDPVKPEELVRRWTGSEAPAASTGLPAVVGVTQDGPFTVDLVADGPHALVAGTTGAGKSELLRSLVASLASSVSPSRLNFVLIDFKGGGAFDACEQFPHSVAVVTDLDEHLAMRALRCLRAELKLRERLLRAAGASNLDEYWEAATDVSLPRLLIVVDEFATLATELPEFMGSLVDIAQRGRSLGIHMVLATQRPSGVLDAKIRANTNLRIALRVQDVADSTDVIGTATAAQIDRKLPGRAIARLGAGDMMPFQSALVTAATQRDSRRDVDIAPFTMVRQPTDAAGPQSAPDGPTDLERLVELATEASALMELPAPRVPWPDPLPSRLAYEDIPAASGESPWEVPIGMADLPDEQRVDPYSFDATDGSLVVYGMQGADTGEAVAAIALGLATGLRPDRLNVYVADFGGGVLAPLENLDHVAGYVTASDDERIVRLIDRLEDELERRRTLLRAGGDSTLTAAAGEPLVIAIIHNYAGFTEWCEDGGHFELAQRLAAVVRDGAALGVLGLLTSTSERGVPHKLAAEIGQKLVMRLADPNGYGAFGYRSKEVPELGAGRALDISTRLEVQIAEPATGSSRGAVRTINQAHGDEIAGPEPLRMLPSEVPLADVIAESAAEDGRWSLAIGLGYHDLQAAHLTLRSGQHAVVAGPPGSGRTTTLRALAVAVASAQPDCAVLSVGMETTEPEVAALSTPQQIDELEDVATLLLVDNAERLDPEFTAALVRLIDRRPQHVHIIAAGSPDEFAAYQSWTKGLRSSRVGVLLQPHAEDGEIVKTRLPIRGATRYPAGRGFVVTMGIAELVQIASPDITSDLDPESDGAVLPMAPFLERKALA